MQADAVLYEKRLREHWRRFQATFRLPDDRQLFVYQDIVRHYGESHRRYHGIRHPVLLLDELEIARKSMPEWFKDPKQDLAIELSIWDHNIFYNAREKNNEELSAEHVIWHAHHLGISPIVGAESALIILATKHVERPKVLSAQIVCDIDLSLLGSTWLGFVESTLQIREEYSHLSDKEWREGRRAFLDGMIKRNRIYSTDYFHKRFETATQVNIRRAFREQFTN